MAAVLSEFLNSDLGEAVLKLTLALLCGGLLGLERGMKKRPAGFRTYMLVCLGSTLVVMTNMHMIELFQTGDPGRMGAQVVSGIGFLGAGTIIVTRHSQIKGLTTAAGLWTSAAVGLATGIGFYEAAVIGAAFIFIILSVLSNLDSRMHRKADHFEAYVELPEAVSLGMLMDALNTCGIAVEDAQLDAHLAFSDGRRSFLMELSTQKRLTRAELLARINQTANQAEVPLSSCRII